MTLNVAAAVRLPTSYTLTQYDPGFSVTVICGVVLATVDVDVASVHEDVPLGVPTPTPTATVDDNAASVTLTVPAWATVNVDMLEPCTPTEPVNVTLVAVGVDDVEEGDVRFFSASHPAVDRAAISTAASSRDDSDIVVVIVVHQPDLERSLMNRRAGMAERGRRALARRRYRRTVIGAPENVMSCAVVLPARRTRIGRRAGGRMRDPSASRRSSRRSRSVQRIAIGIQSPRSWA